jgi:hypothetical protein
VTSPGAWVVSAFKSNGKKIWATMFRWLPMPPVTLQPIANGKGGVVAGIFLGNVTGNTHWPYPPDYPSLVGDAASYQAGTPFTDGPTGPGLVLNTPWVSGSGQSFTDYRGRTIQTVPAQVPSSAPPGMSGGAWYSQSGLFVYAAPAALGSSNTALYVALGVGVVGVGAAAAFL